MLSLNATFLIQLAIFLTVMTCLNFLIFRPLARLYQRREDTIRGLGEAVSRLEQEKSDRQAEYQKSLQDLRNELLLMKSTYKAEMEKERLIIIDQARQKAELLLKKEEEDMKADILQAKKSFEVQTRQTAAAIFTQIVGRTLEAGG